MSTALPPSVRSEDFPGLVPYRVNSSSQHLGWRGFRVEVVRGHAAGELSLPPLDHHLLNMIVSARTRHEHRWDGLAAESVGHVGTASLVPAGRDSYWRWNYLSPATPCDFHLHLHPDFINFVALHSHSRIDANVHLRGELCFHKSELQALCMALLRETEQGGPNGPLYAESITAALVTLLLNMQEPRRLQSKVRTERISRERLKTICDYIEAHLGTELHLDSLSALCGLGPEHLRESFRAHLGESPHRYVTRRRIERARDLLRSTRLPVTEIALRLGFADHSHFTSTFRREAGLTPSRFRAEAAR